MSLLPDWLPSLILLEDYAGNWDRYLAEVYGVFYGDFRSSRPIFGGQAVKYDDRLQNGKETAFWHMISEEDKATGQRLPDLRRCERIRWVRTVIEHIDDERVSVWENERHGRKRIVLWMEEQDYLVVLEERPKGYFLLTAYRTNREHTRRKLRRDRERAQRKSKRRPKGTA